MAELSAGRKEALVVEQGPRELRALTASFNRLVEELAVRAAQAARLEAQMARIQAEERADLARDLHDDIGPLLFLAKIDLASLARHPSLEARPEIRETASGVIEHLSQIQASLRDILHRLQPRRDSELSLAEAAETSLAHWAGALSGHRLSLGRRPGPRPAAAAHSRRRMPCHHGIHQQRRPACRTLPAFGRADRECCGQIGDHRAK